MAPPGFSDQCVRVSPGRTRCGAAAQVQGEKDERLVRCFGRGGASVVAVSLARRGLGWLKIVGVAGRWRSEGVGITVTMQIRC